MEALKQAFYVISPYDLGSDEDNRYRDSVDKILEDYQQGLIK